MSDYTVYKVIFILKKKKKDSFIHTSPCSLRHGERENQVVMLSAFPEEV